MNVSVIVVFLHNIQQTEEMFLDLDTWARVGRVLDWRCPGPTLCTTVVTMTRILIRDAGGCRSLDRGASIGHNIVDTIATRACTNMGTFVTVNSSNTFAVRGALVLCCCAVVPPASISCCRWLYPDTATTQSNTGQLQLPVTVRYLLSSSPKLMGNGNL